MIISMSVRDIVNFSLYSGSIDSRYVGKSRALQGTLIHKKIQEKNIKEIKGYEKEVSLSKDFIFDNFTLRVEGRADGVIYDEEVIVEEIKTTNKNLIYVDKDFNELHWAQAKFYAYIICCEKNLKNIKVRLIYYCIVTDGIKEFEEQYSDKELEEYVAKIIADFKQMADYSINWRMLRNTSIDNIEFPFVNYREGQRNLSVAVYNTIKEQKELFIKAPTGIGKTISTIFPAVKAVGQNKIDKIFYLTAKTITRTAAEEAFKLLRDNKLKFKIVTLTAKEKICFNEEVKCNPEECRFACNYYDKLKISLHDILLQYENFNRENIETIARKYEICPFELSLEIAKWCDGIICDYNYIFDPSAALKTIFEDSNDRLTVLIDEAHNLVGRAREMYSGELIKSEILKIKKLLTGKAPKISGILGKINSELISYRRELQEENIEYKVINEVSSELKKNLRLFLKETDDFLVKNQSLDYINDVMELYFNINNFMNVVSEIDDHYINYVDISNKDVYVKLFCIDPSKKLRERMDKIRSTILFSATMLPMTYYISLLGGDDNTYRMFLESPFNKENLSINVLPLSTKYKFRENTLDSVVDAIHDIKDAKKGNYIVFFPSYSYMNKAYKHYIDKYGSENTILQQSDMSEKLKEDFLEYFDENEILAFCVMGGLFSEGIDLKGDKLIGTIIIGVGLPQVCLEQELIKDYFNKKSVSGYDYAYTYPGMNKVLQAVGRVIRTEEDEGVAILVDDRFLSMKYKELMPSEWSNMHVVKNCEELINNVDEFWKIKSQM